VDFGDVLAGTHCIEIAQLGPLRIPLRAVSELERDDIERAARAVVDLALPGAMREELFEDRRWSFLLARAAMDPASLVDGERRPLFRPSELAALAATDVDVLHGAQVRAQGRATPPFDMDIVEALKARAAEHHFDAVRAKRMSAADFFGVPPRELTFWQHFYFTELA
jgi:hypothetical protein